MRALLTGFILLIFSFATQASPAPQFTALTLNLHGYHPTQEAIRWAETRQGKINKTDSQLFFFTPEELDRGHRRRLDQLAIDLIKLNPDIVFFQEVAGGAPTGPRNCESFYANFFNDDRFEKNSVLRLSDRLSSQSHPYQVALACRGNIGWWTTPETFAKQRILRASARPGGKTEIVWNFGANPYPHGLFTEGLAVIVRKPWRILKNFNEWLETGQADSKLFYQAVSIQNNTDQTQAVLINIHSTHGIRHFEQAVALRMRIQEKFSEWAQGAQTHLLVAGDYNESLFRPAQPTAMGNPSMVPWEVFFPGHFDFRPPVQEDRLIRLREALLSTNQQAASKNPDEGGDAAAAIRDPIQAAHRVDAAIQKFHKFILQTLPQELLLQESLALAQMAERCPTSFPLPAACTFNNRIDHIFIKPTLTLLQAAVIYPKNDWIRLDSLSDHPGIWALFKY